MPKPYEIVVPLFNDEANLVNLLDSLIDVGISPSDVIVSMSGPRGDIENLVEKYGFRLIYSDNQKNPAMTRNQGAKKVDADYMVFLDSDVLVTDEWRKALDDICDKKSVFLTGDTVHVSATPNWLELFWFARIERKDKRYINGANIIVKNDFFWKLEGFDESLVSGEDFDFSIRAERSGNPPVLDDRLKVFHEGYPKSTRDFLKREYWHASGDLVSLRAFFKSNVMMAVAVYMILILFAIVSLFTAPLSLFPVVVVCLLGFSAILTIYKIGWYGKTTFISAMIMNVYLMGRGMALISVLSRPICQLLNVNRL